MVKILVIGKQSLISWLTLKFKIFGSSITKNTILRKIQLKSQKTKHKHFIINKYVNVKFNEYVTQ